MSWTDTVDCLRAVAASQMSVRLFAARCATVGPLSSDQPRRRVNRIDGKPQLHLRSEAFRGGWREHGRFTEWVVSLDIGRGDPVRLKIAAVEYVVHG